MQREILGVGFNEIGLADPKFSLSQHLATKTSWLPIFDTKPQRGYQVKRTQFFYMSCVDFMINLDLNREWPY